MWQSPSTVGVRHGLCIGFCGCVGLLRIAACICACCTWSAPELRGQAWLIFFGSILARVCPHSVSQHYCPHMRRELIAPYQCAQVDHGQWHSPLAELNRLQLPSSFACCPEFYF